jgi:hypothetical protein
LKESFRVRLVRSFEDLEDLAADVASRLGCASRELLPSLARRATYVLVAGSSRILVGVIVCIARFSWRFLSSPVEPVLVGQKLLSFRV